MSRAWKTIIILLAALITLLLAALVGGYFFFINKLEKAAADLVIKEAKKSGANIKFDDFSLSPLSAHSKEIDIFIPKAFVNLKLKNPQININPLSLLTLNPQLKFKTVFYDSAVDAAIAHHIPSRLTQIKLSLSSLDLSKIPEMAVLNIDKGSISFSLYEMKISQGSLNNFQGDFVLKELSTARGFVLPTSLGRQRRQNILVPPINFLNLKSTFSFKENTLEINDGTIHSSFTDVEFKSKINFSQNLNIENISFNSVFRLSAKGAEFFGYLLPEISNNMLTTSQSSFGFSIFGRPHELNYDFKPIN